MKYFKIQYILLDITIVTTIVYFITDINSSFLSFKLVKNAEYKRNQAVEIKLNNLPIIMVVLFGFRLSLFGRYFVITLSSSFGLFTSKGHSRKYVS